MANFLGSFIAELKVIVERELTWKIEGAAVTFDPGLLDAVRVNLVDVLVVVLESDKQSLERDPENSRLIYLIVDSVLLNIICQNRPKHI